MPSSICTSNGHIDKINKKSKILPLPFNLDQTFVSMLGVILIAYIVHMGPYQLGIEYK